MAYLHETASSQVSLFFSLAEKYGNDVFMCAKFSNGEPSKNWENITWRQTAEQVRHMGAGLIAMGIQPGERIGIFANNRPRWIISDQAIQGAGAVGVPIYPTSTDNQLSFILNDCKATALIAGDPELLGQALRIKDETPHLKFIVSLAPVKGTVDPCVTGYDELQEKGKNDSVSLKEFEARRNAIKEEDPAAIIYTSGTTGNPKGVVLTQENFKAQTRLVMNAPITRRLLDRGIRLSTLSHLPLCHIMGRASDYHAQMTMGSVIYFAESIKTVQKNLLEVRPQVLASIPRLYEKIYEAVNHYASKLTGFKKEVFNWAMEAGSKASDYMIRGERLPLKISINFALANIMVYRHIRKFAGLDRLVSAISGGGPLSADIIKFFRSMNIIIAEGYGLTETTSSIAWNGPRFIEPLPDDPIHRKAFEWLIDTMVVMQSQGQSPFTSLKGFLKIVVASKLIIPYMVIKPGYVGRPLDETLMKLGDDGEILVKGPQVFSPGKGYYNLEDQTNDMFTEDGFFKTGDIGEFDEDGFLKITDRKKELLVTSGGKNIAPQPLELALSLDPLIDQTCVVGDSRKYIAALIVPQFDFLEQYARANAISFIDRKDLIENPKIIAMYTERINEINKKFARYEQIKTFRLLPEPFTVETGELTPTMKMKRRVIKEKYADEIDSLYDQENPSIF
ncbi:MAG: long-chain fatty acid--CoA ligase [Desulfobacteraceae bacterium]|jgi:long-chain acyl-CoA synthetase